MSRRKRRRQHRDDRPPPNAERLMELLIEWSTTGEAPGELEAMAELLHRRLHQQYGDREWTDAEVFAALEQLGDRAARLDSAMRAIGL
jgi:hypothetical protein